MLAVQAEAAAAFRKKDWATVVALLKAFDEPQARFASAWALLEQGLVHDGAQQIQQLFRTVAGPLEFDQAMPWSLWQLRKRFGPSTLIEWGLHDALMQKLWLSLTDLPVADSNAFATEWVEPTVLALMTQLPPQVRPPLPWQLGGSAPVLDEEAFARVRAWAFEQAKALGLGLAPPAKRADFASHFGAQISLAGSENRLRRLAREYDALLLLEDVRLRVPEAVRPRITSVIFRATPKRVVDAVIVALDQPQTYGALVRHLVPAGEKTNAALTWVEGSRDEVIAAMPASLFESALAAITRLGS